MDSREIKNAATNIKEMASLCRRAAFMLENHRSGAAAHRLLNRVRDEIPGILMRIDNKESLDYEPPKRKHDPANNNCPINADPRNESCSCE